MNRMLVGMVMAVLAGGAQFQAAHADTAAASCEVRKDGNKWQGASGPCSFSQRQGYIDVGLKNGDKISLSPDGSAAGKYKDDRGNKVTRTSATATGMDFKWEGGRHLKVTWAASGGGGAAAAAPAKKASGAPSKQEQACLAAVSRETNNGEVAVLSSEFSQANTVVMIGVGAQRAPWRCLVSNSGVVQEVMFTGSEGRL